MYFTPLHNNTLRKRLSFIWESDCKNSGYIPGLNYPDYLRQIRTVAILHEWEEQMLSETGATAADLSSIQT